MMKENRSHTVAWTIQYLSSGQLKMTDTQKLRGVKMQDLNMTDQVTRHENAGPEK